VNKCKPTDPFVTITRASKSVIMKREMFVDMFRSSGDRNVIKKERKQFLKYEDFAI
jgi:hypothetical protein